MKRFAKISQIITTLFLIYSLQISGAIKTFTATGNFSDATKWNGSTLPVAGDDLRINANCTFDNLANNLVYGTLNVGFAAAATLQWPVGGTNTLNVSTVSSTTAGSSINMTNGGTLQIRTSWTTTNQTFTPGTGTIHWNVTGANSTLPAGRNTYYNLTTTVSTQTVSLGVNTVVNNSLTISSGTLRVNTFNITVNGTTNVSGSYFDNSNTGTNTFVGLVTINPGGSWNSTTETTATGLVFRGGITNNGTSFTAGAATFNTNPQTITGTTALSFANLVTITGINATNTGTVTISSTAAGALTGTGTWTQGNNSVLNYAGSTITVTTFAANTATNTVNYNRAGAQTIFTTTYRNLSISGSGTKSLGGSIVINNDLTINTGTTLNPVANNLTVNGSSAIAGTFGDSNAGGTTTLQDLDLSGGTINGTATGTVTVNGALTNPTGNATIGRVALTVNGTTTASNTFTLNNNNGVKIFAGTVTISPAASWVSTTITTTANLVFRNGITHNGTSFTAAAATFNTNNQSINGSSVLNFSNIVTVTSITVTNNNTVNITSTLANRLTGTGKWTQGIGGTLNIANSSFNITQVDFNTDSNLVSYNGNIAQTIYNTSYYNLALSTGATSVAKTIAVSPLNIDRNLTLTNGTGTVTLNIGANTVNLDSNLSGNGTITITTGTLNIGGNNAHTGTFNYGTGLVQYNGGNQLVRGTTYYDLTISGTNTKTLGGSTIINHNLGISSTLDVSTNNYGIDLKGNWNNTGTFTPAVGTVTLSGISTQTITNTSGETFNNLELRGTNTVMLEGDITLNNNLYIANTCTLDVTVSDYSIDLKGNWSNDGIFAASTGTVTLSGTAQQSITSADTNTFHHLVLNNASGAALLSTQIVTGVLLLNSGTFTTNGNLLLTSNATYTGAIGPISSGANISGNVTMQRFAPGGKTGWAIIGAPISSALTLSDIDDDIYISCSTCPDGTAAGFTSVYTYNEPAPGTYTSSASYIPISGINTPVVSGKGYYVYLGTGYTNTTDITWDITGTVSTFTQNISLSYTNTGSPADDGWNMIANPYPCPISWSALKGANPNVEDAVYAWNTDLNSGSGAFATYVSGVSNPLVGSGGIGNTIPIGQGFFVHATAATTLTATENIKTLGNPTFLKTGDQPGKVFRLFLDGADTTHDETAFHFKYGASNNFDSRFDALKLLSKDNTSPYIASEGNNNIIYSINSIPDSTFSISIPVKVITPASGTFTITPYALSELPANACVTLYDRHQGVSHDLRDGSYVFNLSDTTVSARFILIISNSALATTSQVTQPSCNYSTAKVIISGNNSGPWDFVWKNEKEQIIKTSLSKSSPDTLATNYEGKYTVYINTVGSCDLVSKEFEVKKLTTPTVQFNITNNQNKCSTVVTENKSKNSVNYLWDFGDGTLYSESNPVHTYTSSGYYTVKLIASNDAGCTQELAQQIYISCQEENSPNAYISFNSNNTETLIIEHANNPFIISYYDITGRLVAETIVNEIQNTQFEIPKNDFAKGIYTINISYTNGNRFKSIKWINKL